MKKKRFAVEQIVAVLKEAEAGLLVAELTRRIGITRFLSTRSFALIHKG